MMRNIAVVWQHQCQTAPEDVALPMATLLTTVSVRLQQPTDVLVLIWWWRQIRRPDCLKWRHFDSFNHGQSSLDASCGLFRQFGCFIEIQSLMYVGVLPSDDFNVRAQRGL
jgi:hypothetical protein